MTGLTCNSIIGKLASTAMVAGMLIGCQIPLDHAACPCAEGWVCCPASQTCVAADTECPGDPPEPPRTQRLSIDRPWLDDLFGMGIAVSGDLAAIGVPGSDRAAHNGGEVDVFERRGGGTGVWVRIAVITAPDPRATAAFGTSFGTSLAFVGGDQLVVGAPLGPGGAYLFRRDADGWSWRETLAPDLTNVAEDARDTLRFGSAIAADGDRFVISGYDSLAFLYQLTEGATRYVAQLTDVPSAGALRPWSGVAMHGSSVLVFDGRSMGVYVYEEATGWAGTRVADLGKIPLPPRTVAFDGARIAVPGKPGELRIVERTASGWGPPIDVPLPADAGTWQPMALAWHGDGLTMTSWLQSHLNTNLGFSRVRSVAGTWVPDPIAPQDGAPNWTAIAVSAERALVTDPYTNVGLGAAKVYRLDGGNYVQDSTITLEDRAPIRSVAAGPGQLIANRWAGEQIAWFARDAEGQYRARPALAIAPGLKLGGQVVVSGSHALTSVIGDKIGPLGVQAFELGAHDWSAGSFLPAPDAADAVFPAEVQSSIAIDGDTAAIALHHPWPGVDQTLIYAWSSGGWAQTDTLPGATCSPYTESRYSATSVALGGRFLAEYCGVAQVRMFQRAGASWTAMPAPVLPGTSFTARVLLSGDRALFVTASPVDGHRMVDVLRWTGTAWHDELHLDAPALGNGRLESAGVAFDGDRLVVARDSRSVTPYLRQDGAWIEQAPVALPDQPRNPDATLADVALNDDGIIVSVDADAGDSERPEGAIYVIPWPR